MHDYGMLTDGDRVLVAVSGGIDSLVTAWVLHTWRDKAPIHYDLEAIYVDNGFWSPDSGLQSPAEQIGAHMRRFGIDFSVVTGWPVASGEQRNCFACARNRRSQLFEIAREKGCRKLALGHHKDDLVETFFLNALYSGNISTMLPRQDLFEGKLSLIRVLAYLEKSEVISIGNNLDIRPVQNLCPLAGDTRREAVRDILEEIYQKIPDAKGSIFSALGNIREGYML